MLQHLVLVVMCSIGIKNCEVPRDAVVQTLTTQNMTEYLLHNPGVELLQPLERTLLSNMRYTIGSRVDGDRVVASAFAGEIWRTKQNVTSKLEYPKEGTGAVVSYVEIMVKQSSNLGKAYVVDGGIRQRHINIVLEALNTYYLEYHMKIYGY